MNKLTTGEKLTVLGLILFSLCECIFAILLYSSGWVYYAFLVFSLAILLAIIFNSYIIYKHTKDE